MSLINIESLAAASEATETSAAISSQVSRNTERSSLVADDTLPMPPSTPLPTPSANAAQIGPRPVLVLGMGYTTQEEVARVLARSIPLLVLLALRWPNTRHLIFY
jgi:hypothetical protein